MSLIQFPEHFRTKLFFLAVVAYTMTCVFMVGPTKLKKQMDIPGLALPAYRNIKYPVVNESIELAIRKEVERNCQDIFFLRVWGNNLSCRYYQHTQKLTPFLSEMLEMRYVENFKIVKNASDLCSDNEVDMVFIIHTAPPHFWERFVIRNTWGAALQQLHERVKIAFIVGESMVENVNKKVWDETEKYGDMILVEMLDQYQKLTLKDLLLFRWARDFCPQASFILKCDDDIVVNPLVYPVIRKQIMTSENTEAVFGRFYDGPVQRESPKSGLPSYYYPFSWGPIFPMGPAVIIGKKASRKFLEISKIVPYLGLDDFFLFGLVASLGNITRVSTGDLIYGRPSQNPVKGDPKFVWLTKGPKQMEENWKRFVAPLLNL